jgi:hypothetical protein
MATRQTGARPEWGERHAGRLASALQRLRGMLGAKRPAARASLGSLPLQLRRTEVAAPYLAAEANGDHQRAGAAATAAMQAATSAGEWWPADIWGHRALWHFERAGMELAATRAARLIGDVRWLAGDPASSRRYYAEAISEARDLGAEREEGLAALGMGRAALDLGDVTTARRLGDIAAGLLERCGAPADELAAARELHGEEREVG